MKQVQFGEATVHIVEKTPVTDHPNVWYNSDELIQLLEQEKQKFSVSDSDLGTFTTRGLEQDHRLSGLLTEFNNDHNDKDCYTHTKRPQLPYIRDVLGIYKYGKAEYGSVDPDMLRSFAVSRSKQDCERAEEMGKQDEKEAFDSYVESIWNEQQKQQQKQMDQKSCAMALRAANQYVVPGTQHQVA